jgi:N-acetylmuramic acid 6-phosphate etherase
MLGAASATGIPRCRSIRHFPKVAALAELPRAQVTTTRGGEFLSKATSLVRGRASVSDWRRTASGASRSSVAISGPLLLLGELTVRMPPDTHSAHLLRPKPRAIPQRSHDCERAAKPGQAPSEYSRVHMKTEESSPRYSSIDRWDPADVLESLIEGQFSAVAAVRAALPAIRSAAVAMEARLRERGRLVYAGAGTSGRLAVQDGAELTPTFGWPNDRLLLLIAGGRDALLQSVEGAEDDIANARQLIGQHGIGADDVVVAVAASGTTPFTLACLRESRTRGALTVGIANNQGTPVLQESHHPIFLDTGPEPIAGSTRLKAGTAQKITLNGLSTLLMILLGRVYRGLMVDVRASNEKLVRRSEDMLVQLTGCNQAEARNALNAASGRVKLAVLLLHGCDLKLAEDLLDRARGHLGKALELMDSPD